jgi:hypothetical protein
MARQQSKPTQALPGVVRGKITRPGSVAGSYFVQVPRVHGDDELGPFECVAIVGALVATDRVVLAPVEGRADDLIIIGKL